MPPVQCQNCGLVVQVPAGGRRLCGCGSWLSSDEPVAVAEVLPASEAERWPRLEGDLSAVERLNNGYRRLQKELNKAIVGQQRVLEELIIAVFARGHCLLVGVPGLAKTLMIRTLADSMNLSFSRVQFTPDLMPSDITGTEVLQEDKATGQRAFKFLHGPLFANVILADEINRTPPKTQAALLEAMQERQVTVGGARHRLPDPFFVLATQNPIEQEGTYPLPEAQQDRFMFSIHVDYPEEDEEFRIVEMTTTTHTPQLERVLSATWGAGPRATQYLVLGAKARAVLHGRYYVSCEDIRAVAGPVLRHRIITNFNAEAEGIKPDDIIRRLADVIPRDPNEELVPSTARANLEE